MRGLLAVGLLACCASARGEEGDGAGAKIQWAKTLDEAVAEAKKSNKLVMVDFYTTWCGPCKMLDAQTYSNADVAKFAAKELVALKLDAEKEGADAAAKYKVEAYPTILFLDGDGAPSGRLVGFLPAKPFIAKATGVVKAAKEFPALVKAFADDHTDAKAVEGLAKAYAVRGDFAEAKKVLKKAGEAGLKGDALAAVCNDVGDELQTAQNFPEAIELFRKAADLGKPERKGYALMSIGACEASQGKLKEAAKHAREALAVEGISDKLKKEGEQQLAQLAQQRKTLSAQLDRQIKMIEDRLKQMRKSREDLGDDAKKDAG